ncbi:MAG: oligosaccharide flippase family protein [Chitinophagales bacterium]
MQQKLISSTILYSFLFFLQPFVSLVLLQPFYLNYFPSEEYGILSLMGNYSTLIGMICALSITSAFFTFYYNYHHNYERLRRFLGQMLTLTLYLSIFSTAIIFLFGESLFRIGFKDDALTFYPYGYLATLQGVAYNFHAPYMAYLRNKKQLRFYAVLQLSSIFLSTGLQVLFVLAGWGVVGVLAGKSIGSWVIAIAVLHLNREYLTWRIDWKYFVRPFQFVKYFLPQTLLDWFYSFGDKFIIERFCTLSLVGIYSLLNVLAGAIELAYFAVRAAILPFFYEALEKEKTTQRKEIQQLYEFYFLLTVFAVSGIVLLVGHIHWVITKKDYLAIQVYIFIYSIGYLFSAISYLAYQQFYYYKNTKTTFQIQVASTLLIVVLNLWLIPLLQIWGAVIASLVTRILVFILLCVFYPSYLFPLKSPRIYLPFIATTTILVIGFFSAQQTYMNYTQASIMQFIFTSLTMLFVFKSTLKAWLSKLKTVQRL